METGQGNSQSTTVTQKILGEEDASGFSVLPTESGEKVCTKDLLSALSFLAQGQVNIFEC